MTSLRSDGVGGGGILLIEDMDVKEDEERRGKLVEDLIQVLLDP